MKRKLFISLIVMALLLSFRASSVLALTIGHVTGSFAF